MTEQENKPDLEEKVTSPYNSVFRLFLIPLIIVIFSVGLFYAFGFFTFENKTVEDYLYEIKAGSKAKKWQAAYSMAGLLVTEEKADPELQALLTKQIIPLFKNKEKYELRVRSYLALALGYLKQKESVPVLIEALKGDEEDIVLYSAWGLSVLGDARAQAPLIPLLKDKRPAIRKISAFALGVFPGDSAIPGLKSVLNDSVPDVTWNAALSLSQLGDASGEDILIQLLQRSYLETFPNLAEEEKDQIMKNAITGLVNIKAIEEHQGFIEVLSKKDSSLKVRQTAIEALKK